MWRWRRELRVWVARKVVTCTPAVGLAPRRLASGTRGASAAARTCCVIIVDAFSVESKPKRPIVQPYDADVDHAVPSGTFMPTTMT